MCDSSLSNESPPTHTHKSPFRGHNIHNSKSVYCNIQQKRLMENNVIKEAKIPSQPDTTRFGSTLVPQDGGILLYSLKIGNKGESVAQYLLCCNYERRNRVWPSSALQTRCNHSNVGTLLSALITYVHGFTDAFTLSLIFTSATQSLIPLEEKHFNFPLLFIHCLPQLQQFSISYRCFFLFVFFLWIIDSAQNRVLWCLYLCRAFENNWGGGFFCVFFS